MDKVEKLLDVATVIQKKYEDLAEYSGEHYNIFNILGVRSHELSHSSILANLLDAKGQHGQKELFLNLFIDAIKKQFEDSGKPQFKDVEKLQVLNHFDVKNSFTIKEKYVGRVDCDTDQGGRIDILICDGKNNIIIENKVYASDQPKQLVRYNEHDKTAPILYLTLDGCEPSADSKGDLVLNKDYFCISYAYFIKKWLENCIKETATKPIIRETLNQYLYLIKSLTNQSNNNKMSEEIVKSMKNNISSSFEVSRNIKSLKKSLYEDLIKDLKDNEKGYVITDTNQGEYYGVDVNFENIIRVLFGKENDKDYCSSVSCGYQTNVEILSESKRNAYIQSGFIISNGWVYKWIKNGNWGDNEDIWEDVAKRKEGKIYKEIISTIEEIIEFEKL